MAEAIVFDMATEIIKQFGTAAVKEIYGFSCGFRNELDSLQDDISGIKDVLVDAERKQGTDNQIKNWLKRLESSVYDADDLVNEFHTEALRRRVMPAGTEMSKKVLIFFSKSNQLFFQYQMSQWIKQIRYDLDRTKSMRDFHLDVLPNTPMAISVRETYSFVDKEVVIGRSKERTRIMKILLDSQFEEHVFFLPIIGMGGLGKTAFARYVFTDVVEKDFELKMWVCIGVEFHLESIARKIILSARDDSIAREKMEKEKKDGVINKLKSSLQGLSLDQLLSRIRNEIEGKKYLLVLDDVWNDNISSWNTLREQLARGAKGSKVLVTTRSKLVAKIIGTTDQPFELSSLDSELSWSLFEKAAFKKGHEPAENSRIATIGKEIVEKCRGVPLAITSIGTLMFTKDEVHEWESVRQVDLVKACQNENDILPTLELSYTHLPRHLKHCFAYCKLFPKGYEFSVQMLVKLWIAQGFIQPSDPIQYLEDVGYGYFKTLLWRSFFHEAKMNLEGNIRWCKMHDLMHELATLVGGDCSTIVVNPSLEMLDEKWRHVSFDFERNQSLIHKCLLSKRKIRTLMQIKKVINNEVEVEMISSNFKRLRVLGLRKLNMKTLPSNMGRFKHLTYLDLSENAEIEMLPSSSTRLLNLQTLNLGGCSKLSQLPSDIDRLINLRHLDVSSSAITDLPISIIKLQSLQTLNLNWCSKLSILPKDMKNLVSLRDLNMCGCQSLAYSPHAEIDGLSCQIEADMFTLFQQSTNGGGYGILNRLHCTNGYLKLNINGRWEENALGFSANLRNMVGYDNMKREWPLDDDVPIWPSDLEDKDEDKFGKEIVFAEKMMEGLGLPLNIRTVYFTGYMGWRLPMWSSSMQNLVSLTLYLCPGMLYIAPLHQLPSLETLIILTSHFMDYVCEDRCILTLASASAHFFPSLVHLTIAYMSSFKGWWQRDINEQEKEAPQPTFPKLAKLHIEDIPFLAFLPNFPTVQDLTWKLANCEALQPTLDMRRGRIPYDNEGRASSSSSSSSSLFALSNLKHVLLNNVDRVPEEIFSISSLETLKIENLPFLKSLPEEIGNLVLLQSLHITKCENLNSLPDTLSRLKLQELIIEGCPILSNTCQENTGDDWPKVAHIPTVELKP